MDQRLDRFLARLISALSLLLHPSAQKLLLEQYEKYLQNNPNIPAFEKQLGRWNSQLTQRQSNHQRLTELKKDIAESRKNITENTSGIEKTGKSLKSEQEKLDLLVEDIKILENYYGI